MRVELHIYNLSVSNPLMLIPYRSLVNDYPLSFINPIVWKPFNKGGIHI